MAGRNGGVPVDGAGAIEGFSVQVSGTTVPQPDTSYETRPKWHGFLMIKLTAFAAGDQAEQRTAEYRYSLFQSFSFD